MRTSLFVFLLNTPTAQTSQTQTDNQAHRPTHRFQVSQAYTESPKQSQGVGFNCFQMQVQDRAHTSTETNLLLCWSQQKDCLNELSVSGWEMSLDYYKWEKCLLLVPHGGKEPGQPQWPWAKRIYVNIKHYGLTDNRFSTRYCSCSNSVFCFADVAHVYTEPLILRLNGTSLSLEADDGNNCSSSELHSELTPSQCITCE